jgi:hypothetical protein
MLIASDLLQNDFDEPNAKLLAQAWKVTLPDRETVDLDIAQARFADFKRAH